MAAKASSSLYARRKTFAIKHEEAEPLTRRDIQYDFLQHVFSNTQRVFTDPLAKPDTKSSFRDLYVHALMASARCSKALREKMQDAPDFATDFARISLLANVGRVNTTMTFLPEMRTSLRTYHPVPALQKSDGNLQDAPRIKNILKACSLKDEVNSLPVTPAELRARGAKGAVPSTSIVNLLFVLSNHFTNVAHEHFGRLDIDFLDLFLPVHISSASRAQAFLWLVYHYHEHPTSANPFDDQYSRSHRGLVPKLVDITPDDFAQENVDTDEEKAYGVKMSQYRLDFLEKSAKTALEKEQAEAAGSQPPAAPEKKKGGKGKAKGKAPSEKATPRKRGRADVEPEPAPTPAEDAEAVEARPLQRRRLSYNRFTPEVPTRPPPEASPRHAHPVDELFRRGPQRSILQQAWHVVSTLDPLADSDDEGLDAASYFSYGKRPTSGRHEHARELLS
ncbi:hypothetical protein BV25DRAFT_888472 [Artomyces pyxidatus]|uniref:Uncharacterized protein n=1 Tax=Artomyces pyxidatus TaxID=48021 RepID=A0ACB8THP3_9AGAM|nr:hypothetical protein BV25DRAFT_888472 [Artomyces pyxidatus]